MTPTFDPLNHVARYSVVSFYNAIDGYVVWRRGTGDNVELLHLRALRPGAGHRLLKEMLVRLKKDPPYATVFGFTRLCNDRAVDFYNTMGFSLSRVDGVYADGGAYVFSQDYGRLLELHKLR